MFLRYCFVFSLLVISVLSSRAEHKYAMIEGLPLLKGTFIQDFLVKHWDDKRWQEEFTTLKKLGMEYLVFAPTVLTDKNDNITTIYPSDMMGGAAVNQKDLLDICLRNAEKMGFKVFIGLNFNEKWWTAAFTKEWLESEMHAGNSIMEEIISRYKAKYTTAFYGWYWVWEVDNYHSRTIESKEALVSALNINVDYINSHTPHMPILLSPFMNSKLGSSQEYREIWEYVLPKVRFKKGDIFSPQDCVGAGGLQEHQVDEWFGQLSKAVKTNKNLVFWGNVETFNQADWTSRTIDRLIKQMDNVSKHVETIISFAYSHYYSPEVVGPHFHEAYKFYVKNGKIPDLSGLNKELDVQLTKTNEGLELRWETPAISDQVVGYRIYNDQELIREVQLPKTKVKLQLTDHDISKEKYYIVAYNAVGVESDKIFLNTINNNLNN